MEALKDLNAKKFYRSRFELWKKKNKRRKEDYFETKNEFK